MLEAGIPRARQQTMSDQTFRRWEPDRQPLFPPSTRDFVPEGHLAHFVRDPVRDDLDLSAIFARHCERRGQQPCHPALMTSLLLYACSRGIDSSRRIEQACGERVDFMAPIGGKRSFSLDSEALTASRASTRLPAP